MDLTLAIVIFVASGVCSALMTYIVATRQIARRESEARVEAARQRALREAHDEVWDNLQTEQRVTTCKQGLPLIKKRWLVISERICFRGVPISAWVEHRILLEQEIDDKQLDVIARGASVFLNGSASKVLRVAAGER